MVDPNLRDLDKEDNVELGRVWSTNSNIGGFLSPECGTDGGAEVTALVLLPAHLVRPLDDDS